jgi:hypothetical protein
MSPFRFAVLIATRTASRMRFPDRANPHSDLIRTTISASRIAFDRDHTNNVLHHFGKRRLVGIAPTIDRELRLYIGRQFRLKSTVGDLAKLDDREGMSVFYCENEVDEQVIDGEKVRFI